ncbi:MAG: gamma-glutamyltransferase, partial [Hydrogenovibrio sp.]|nr:gamma-glutamyltransferase [Hydrogenovibrio sp.]
MTNRLKHLFICFIVFWLPAVSAGQAAIAMPDKYSAQVAEQILKDGGNAVDAAIASAFVLAVTYPEAGNLGGGGFMTLYASETSRFQGGGIVPDGPRPYFLDYREKAPLAANRDMYLDAKKKVIPYRSLVGYQASGVPGTVMGMWAAHQKFGSVPWARLLKPAIRLAEDGFVVPPELVETAQWYQKWIADKSAQPLNFNRFFGQLKAGTVFKQPRLANTLKQIAENGAHEFYHGATAMKLVKQMQAHKGLITLKDLADYQVKWRRPVKGSWKGYQVISAPPPSSGGVAIIQLLKMKAMLDTPYHEQLAKAEKAGESKLAVQAHFYAELEKRVYADRAKYLGDPDFVKVPVEPLISHAYLAKRIQGVHFDRISKT